MANARNVGGDLDTIGQSNASDLTKCRVRLLGCLREYPHAHTTLLRTSLKRWALRLGSKLLSPLADELTNGRHEHSIDRLHPIHQGLSQHLSPAQSALRSVLAPGLKMTSNVDLAPGNPNTLFVCSCGKYRAITRVKKRFVETARNRSHRFFFFCLYVGSRRGGAELDRVS